MLDFNEIKVEIVEEKGNSGIYTISPLPRGYGHTLVSSLRRILLSSLKGSGITSVKIKGVEHEYSTLEGVKEDVLEILLNLKAVKFKSSSDEPQVCYLEGDGKTTLKAGDIKLTESVEVADKDLEIVTLTDKGASFSAEIVVESGVGYKEANEEERSEVGRIPMDCDFTPIVKVNPVVGATRKGEETQLDSVTVEIETDGSVEPKQALIDASKILQEFAGKVMVALGIAEAEVNELAELSTKIEEPVSGDTLEGEASESTELPSEEESEVMTWKIEDLAISKRSKTALENAGIETIGDLVKLREKEVQEVPGIGAKSVSEIEAMLDSYNLSFKEEENE